MGYEHGDRAGKADAEGPNERNGTRGKTVRTELGPVTLEVPRDRGGWFEPVVVRKRQRRLDGVDEMVLSLSAKGLATGDIADRFAQVYGQAMSKDTVSRITDKVIAEMVEWQNRPLDAGRFPVIVANPDWKGFRCRIARGTRLHPKPESTGWRAAG